MGGRGKKKEQDTSQGPLGTEYAAKYLLKEEFSQKRLDWRAVDLPHKGLRDGEVVDLLCPEAVAAAVETSAGVKEMK